MYELSQSKSLSILILPALLAVLSLHRISQPNSPPVAANDSYTRHGSGGIGPVLANDYDPDNDVMTASVVTLPAHGSLSGVDGNYFSYGPSLGYVGTDSFTYKACDPLGACSNVVTVTIDVVNQPPVGTADSYAVHGNTMIGPMLANDYDPDGDQISYNALTLPTHGTLYGLQQPDKKTYSPNQGYVGTDSFTYKACDSLNLCSPPVTVTLNVWNNPPVPVADFI
jgi:hypothetical protein